jgi:hypothetical protein
MADLLVTLIIVAGGALLCAAFALPALPASALALITWGVPKPKPRQPADIKLADEPALP